MGKRRIREQDVEASDLRSSWRADPPVVAKRSRGVGVCVGTVALSHDDVALPDSVRRIDLQGLSELARTVGPTGADVVLFCGARVEDGAPTAAWNEAGRAAARALGCPFLVECADRAPNEWWLVTPEAGFDAMVRSGQFVTERADVDSTCHLVLAEFGAGLGRVVVRAPDGAETRDLLLLVCGEARMLSLSPERLFLEPVLDWEFRLPKAFAATNSVLLHPAHRPYGRPVPRTGWNLVGEWTDSGGRARMPTLGVAVTSGQRIDGALPFGAAVHAGPFQPGNRWDESVANLAFTAAGPGQGHARLPAAIERSTVAADSGITVRYAEFTV